MSNSKLFRIVAGILSIISMVTFCLILFEVILPPSPKLTASIAYFAVSLAWGIMAGFSK